MAAGLYGKTICPRCGKFSTRIIGGTRCVSCYNREREFKIGRNAKGTRPTMKPLLRRVVRYAIDNGPILSVESDFCADTVELMASVLRRTRGRVNSRSMDGPPAVREGRLF